MFLSELFHNTILFLISGDSATSSAYMLVNSPRHVATTPQGSVRMGISSVQRRIHEQDLKKSEVRRVLCIIYTTLLKKVEDKKKLF